MSNSFSRKLKQVNRLLYLLLWKNFIFRKRNVTLTLLEVFMAPATFGCFAFIVGLSFKGDNDDTFDHQTLSSFSNVTNQNQSQYQFQDEFPYLRECDLIRQTQDELQFGMFNSSCVVGFVPNTVQVRKIMEQVQNVLALETTCQRIKMSNSSAKNLFYSTQAHKRAEIQIQGFDSERELEMAHFKWELIRRKRLCLATVFNASELLNVKNGNRNPRISYKLWYILKTPEKNKDDPENKVKFGITFKKHKRTQVAPEQLVDKDLKMAGFQIILDKVLTKHVLSGKEEETGDPNPIDLNSIRNYSHYYELEPVLGEKSLKNQVHLKSKPKPKPKLVKITKETKAASHITPIVFPGYNFIFLSLIRLIIVEKRSGLKGLLILLGVPSWIHPFSLYIYTTLIGLVSAGLATLCLTCAIWPDFSPLFPESNPFLIFLIMFVYVLQMISIPFTISTFFDTPYLGVLVTLILYCHIALGFVLNLSDMSNLLRHLAVFFVPGVSYAMLMHICGAWEVMGVGIQWDNFSKSMPGAGSMSPSDIFMLMGGSSLAFIILAQYFDNILPQSFAVPKPFYYPLEVFPWFKTKFSADLKHPSRNECVESGSEVRSGFEAEPQGMEPGVSICNLRKEFMHEGKKKVAVDGINLNLYRGQITALLGHNGTGKTTLISMLTGLLKPTSGTAIIDGYDLNEDLTLIRHKLALCPQQNVLCDDLTVYENLLFFGQLKGLSLAEAEKEAVTLMTSLGLTPKKETRAKVLSGGQKRKVQLGISFIGGSSFIFLDEPTSAMDVESRRLVWDLLLEIRKDRTILLTTHYLEEAEVLGDRIAIQDQGRLKCCGTSFFLKQCYEMGYTLHLQFHDHDGDHFGTDGDESYQNDNNGQTRFTKVLDKVREYLEGAKEKPRFLKSTCEFDISLPLVKQDGVVSRTKTNTSSQSSSTSSKFSRLLQDLYEKKEDFGLENIGLSATTMDDVFTAAIVGSKDVQTQDQKTRAELFKSFGIDVMSIPIPNPSSNPKPTELIKIKGFKRTIGQFQALIRRRWQWTINDKILLACQILVPILMMFLGMRTVVQNKFRFETGAGTDLSDILSMDDANLGLKPTSTTKHPLDSVVTRLRGFYSPSTEDSVLVAINAMSNAVLRTVTQTGSDFGSENVSLLSTRHYFNTLDSSALSGGVNAAGEPSVHSYLGFFDMSALFGMGLAIIHITFVILPLQEKQSKIRHLELMTSVSPVTYWLSFLIWDLILSSLITGICILTIFLININEDIDLIQDGGIYALCVSFSVFNFAGISFSYFLTSVCGSPATGLITAIAVLIIGIVTLLVSTIVSMLSDALHSVSGLQYLYFVFPYYGIATTIMNFMATATANSKCNFPMSKEFHDILCDPNVTDIALSDGRRTCCPNCHQDFPGAPCFKSRKYFVWDIDKTETVDGESLTLFGDFTGFGQAVVTVFITGLVYLLIFWANECKMWHRLRHLPLVQSLIHFLSFKFPSIVKQQDEANFASFKPIKNQNVKDEAERVQKQLQKSGNVVERDSFIAENLCKRYGKFRAVSNVSFGVHPGECFGLLGVNGAGKSSLFRILTGEKSPSFGNAFVQNGASSLKENKKNYLAEIGYCPQSDALLDMLTGKQSLELFARLRGCSGKQVDTEVKRWLKSLGLEKSANSACGHFSGGTKRRLNVAMALIGNPSVIFLDEPSAGVDPISRQEFWRVVSDLKNNGQSVILTSHCMDEVETLCSRMTIMVSSVLQCFGTGKHLKEQFPQGYILKIQLKTRMQSAECPELQALISSINKNFIPCTLKESYQNFLTFSLKNPELSLAQTFAVMEELLSQENSLIQEYSVGEPTLEQVFLAVAGYESQQSEKLPQHRDDFSILESRV